MKDINGIFDSNIYRFIKKYFLFILIFILIILITEKIYSSNIYSNATIYYYKDLGQTVSLESYTLPIKNTADTSNTDKIFEAFFNDEKIICIPKNTDLINTKIVSDHLFINVTKDILNYSGSYYENILLSQIAKTALSIDGINYVTILVEGELVYFPEGHNVYKIENINILQ